MSPIAKVLSRASSFLDHAERLNILSLSAVRMPSHATLFQMQEHGFVLQLRCHANQDSADGHTAER